MLQADCEQGPHHARAQTRVLCVVFDKAQYLLFLPLAPKGSPTPLSLVLDYRPLSQPLVRGKALLKLNHCSLLQKPGTDSPPLPSFIEGLHQPTSSADLLVLAIHQRLIFGDSL
jgi:hypothetical protein